MDYLIDKPTRSQLFTLKREYCVMILGSKKYGRTVCKVHKHVPGRCDGCEVDLRNIDLIRLVVARHTGYDA